MRSAGDATAAARIRDAALARFAAQGTASTTVRQIATDAGVSPALVLHHFGSKDGLSDACGRHLLELMRAKTDQARAGGVAGGMAAVDSLMSEGVVLVRYLGRLVVEGGPHADAVVDDLIRLTGDMLDHFETEGVVHPTDDPRMRAALLVSVRMGALVMPDHIARATGSDPLSPEGLVRVSRALLELFTAGLFTDDRYLRAFDAALAGRPPPGEATRPVPPPAATADQSSDQERA